MGFQSGLTGWATVRVGLVVPRPIEEHDNALVGKDCQT
jgi:hypothetical protein